jgi:predicted GNAT family acetyltransferase
VSSQHRAAEIRQLQEDDWAALRAARLAALAEAPSAFGSTVAREQQFGEQTWRDRTRTGAIFGAWSGAEIIGLATVRRDPDEGWGLYGMWVHPDWRASGVAGRLVDAACKAARAAGGRQLVRPGEPDHFEVQLVRALTAR